VDGTELAAIAYSLATVVVIAFQVALALGAPWGAYAMGGRNPGRLPAAMRAAALVQAVVLGGLALVVLSFAGLAVPSLAEDFPWLIWVAVAVSAASVAMNAVSRSPGERRTWVPVGLVLLASSLTVALTAG
jgi:cytochrome bd-type quinol oxidase subunit 2